MIIHETNTTIIIARNAPLRNSIIGIDEYLNIHGRAGIRLPDNSLLLIKKDNEGNITEKYYASDKVEYFD